MAVTEIRAAPHTRLRELAHARQLISNLSPKRKINT
jgi:hypothetical protein